MLNAHVVYTDINHVTAILLAVWARFDFRVGRADSELSFILNTLPAHKAEHLCAVQLEKSHSPHFYQSGLLAACCSWQKETVRFIYMYLASSWGRWVDPRPFVEQETEPQMSPVERA